MVGWPDLSWLKKTWDEEASHLSRMSRSMSTNSRVRLSEYFISTEVSVFPSRSPYKERRRDSEDFQDVLLVYKSNCNLYDKILDPLVELREVTQTARRCRRQIVRVGLCVLRGEGYRDRLAACTP